MPADTLPSMALGLLAQVLERDLDTVIKELLVVGAELVAAARAAVEELTDNADGRVRLTLEECRAAYVDGAVQIQVVDISVGLADQQAWNRLVPDTQHLSTGADWGNVLITPADLSSRRRHATVEPFVSSWTRSVRAKLLRRFSGKGIFTPAIRLMTMRTCSRSAASMVNWKPTVRAPARAIVLSVCDMEWSSLAGPVLRMLRRKPLCGGHERYLKQLHRALRRNSAIPEKIVVCSAQGLSSMAAGAALTDGPM
jgi:hypothetical protein